ncbi:hypothetical protein DIS24_g4323 [Lasiodiplodia hormozganensis]|uniref:Uncharacterized protein n=1 Tax=Lasiodiplodia hormozganensis TaxID=869390 RepID=A0AA40D397_9PEZI|nr:hypothetical protein DIS24_g4323 [Lasiodiplodia hormozganensis]
MFILLAVIIPEVAFFGIKWLVFRPTRLTIHPAGGAFMRVPRGRRRYVFFGPRLPHDPSRNRGSRPRRQRTVVVIRDLESGLHGGSAVHSHADGGGTSNASTTAISGSVCSCSHDQHHGHEGGSEHYITTPEDRELNIKRARTAFGHIATADPRTGAIRAPASFPTTSPQPTFIPSPPTVASVCVPKASESLEKDSTNSTATASAEATQATRGSPKYEAARPGPAGFATASAEAAAAERSGSSPAPSAPSTPQRPR